MASALQDATGEWTGDYTVLYSTINADQVVALEQMIHARRIGQYDEAHRIFEKCLPPFHSLPVLTLERASLAFKQGLYVERSTILRKALTWQGLWKRKIIGHELELLKLLHAEANILAYGKLRQALEEARKVRELLKHFSLNEFTDIEVGCLASYYTIMRHGRNMSNWIHSDIDPFFPVTKPAMAWRGITQLRKALLECGRLWTSHTLLIAEDGVTENSARAALYDEFVTACEKSSFSKSESTLLLLVTTNLYFAEEFIELEMDERAEVCLSRAEKQLENLPYNLQSPDSYRYSPQRLLQRVKVLHNPPPSLAEQFESHQEIIKGAQAAMDIRLVTRSFGTIFEVLTDLAPDERDESWTRITKSSSAAFSEVHSGLKACFLTDWDIIRRLNVWDSNQVAVAGQAIDLLHDFERKYRDFDIPLFQQLLYQLAERSANLIGDQIAAKKYSVKRLAATSNSPAPDQTVMYHYVKQYKELPQDKWPRHLMDIMIGWIKNETKSNLLSVHDAVKLLCLEGECPEEIHHNMTVQAFLGLLEEHSATKLAERVFGIPFLVDDKIWDLRLKRYSTWLGKPNTPVPIHIRHTILGDLQHARCAMFMLHTMGQYENCSTGDNFDDFQLEIHKNVKQENGRLLSLLQTLDSKAPNASTDSIRLATLHYVNSSILLASSAKAFNLGMIKDEDLLEAQTSMEKALAQYPAWERTQRMNALNSISQCMKWRYIVFGTVSVEQALEPLRQHDRLYTTVRRERSVLKGIKNFTAKTTAVSRIASTIHYGQFIELCLEALGITQTRLNHHLAIDNPDSILEMPVMRSLIAQMSEPANHILTSPGMRLLVTELIEWVQKRKARSVIEALGPEILLPKNLLSTIDPQSRAYRLLAEEEELEAKIPIGIGEKLRIVEELEELRKEMRELPDLQAIMDIRDGSSINEAQIKQLSKQLGSNVLIVDYVQMNSDFELGDSEIIAMIYSDGEFCNECVDDFMIKGLSMDDIKKWTRTYLDESYGEHILVDDSSEEALEALIPLTAPIAKFSKRGDTVVLCPTGTLHRIPLHALKVDGQTLIERNPVIYTQSLSLLRLCAMSSLAREPYSYLEAVVAQALPEHQSHWVPSMPFAKQLGATLLSGSSLTKDSLLTAMTTASLIHFHGHVGFDEDTPLDHFLSIRGLKTESISTRDIFELRIPNGAHVTLVGCQSGRSQIGMHDDLVGLSTALHYAGASSIASTLWSIDNADGLAFSEAFYDHLLAQQLENASLGADATAGSAFVDLAKAMQVAVLKIKENTEDGGSKTPYHWAAFTLQGCWKARHPERRRVALG